MSLAGTQARAEQPAAPPHAFSLQGAASGPNPQACAGTRQEALYKDLFVNYGLANRKVQDSVWERREFERIHGDAKKWADRWTQGVVTATTLVIGAGLGGVAVRLSATGMRLASVGGAATGGSLGYFASERVDQAAAAVIRSVGRFAQSAGNGYSVKIPDGSLNVPTGSDGRSVQITSLQGLIHTTSGVIGGGILAQVPDMLDRGSGSILDPTVMQRIQSPAVTNQATQRVEYYGRKELQNLLSELRGMEFDVIKAHEPRIKLQEQGWRTWNVKGVTLLGLWTDKNYVYAKYEQAMDVESIRKASLEVIYQMAGTVALHCQAAQLAGQAPAVSGLSNAKKLREPEREPATPDDGEARSAVATTAR